MSLKDQKVIEIMKKKLEMFNEDEALRDMYYQRDLNKMVIESDKKDARDEGIKEGKIEGKIETLLNLIYARYGKKEKEWIKALNEKQLKSINDIIFKEENYEKFKQEVERTE